MYREYNHRRHDELIRSYEGMAGALGRLRAAGRRLGIVTSKSRDTTAMAFDAVALDGHFDAVVTARDTERHKPRRTRSSSASSGSASTSRRGASTSATARSTSAAGRPPA